MEHDSARHTTTSHQHSHSADNPLTLCQSQSLTLSLLCVQGIFNNLVWECRGNTTLEWMTVRNGQHQWWTRTVAPAFPFETTEYVLRFFTRNWERRHRAE